LTLAISRFPAWQIPGGLFMPSPRAGPDAGPPMSTSPQKLLGKRHRTVDNGFDHEGQEVNGEYGLRTYKRGRSEIATPNGVLEGGGSTNGTHRRPTTGTPASINRKSKAAGRGAERLAAHSAQGLYHRSSQGPSVQQDSTGMIVPEQLPWAEESVERATWHKPNNVVPQEGGESEAAGGDIFNIPRQFEKRHRAFLGANPADWARGTIRVLKCRLCPDAGFKNWADFRRHCDQMEAHPRQIEFCESCGDFFARPDSLIRHRKSRPLRCLRVDSNTAEEKRRKTIVAFEDFKASLEHCLETGEDIGMSFGQIIKKEFPDSSKRGSRQQSRR